MSLVPNDLPALDILAPPMAAIWSTKLPFLHFFWAASLVALDARPVVAFIVLATESAFSDCLSARD